MNVPPEDVAGTRSETWGERTERKGAAAKLSGRPERGRGH